MISIIDELETNDEKLLVSLCAAVCGCLSNKSELYCSLKALFALSTLSNHEMVPGMLEKDLGYIIEHIFGLMKEINLDEILICLKNIVGAFRNQIKPFAKDLLNNLLENFWGIVNSNEDLMREEQEESTERADPDLLAERLIADDPRIEQIDALLDPRERERTLSVGQPPGDEGAVLLGQELDRQEGKRRLGLRVLHSAKHGDTIGRYLRGEARRHGQRQHA